MTQRPRWRTLFRLDRYPITRPRPDRRARPGVEALEGRLAPATLTVNSIADTANATDTYLSLREAIAIFNSPTLPSGLSAQILGQISGTLHAGAADSIQFDPAAVTRPIVLGRGQLVLSLPSTTAQVTTEGGSGGVTVDGNNASRVFQVNAGVQASLAHVTITHGKVTGSPALGGGILTSGSLTLSGCTVSNNQAAGDQSSSTGDAAGGGIYVTSGSLTLSGCTVSNNSAVGASHSSYYSGGSAAGGGISVVGGTVVVNQSTLSGNQAIGGGGASAVIGSYSGHPGGSGSGGGVSVADGAVTVNQSTFSGNQATGGNGGNAGAHYIGDALAGGGGGSSLGGGLSIGGGTVAVTASTFSGNRVGGGHGGNSTYGPTGGPPGGSGGSGLGGGVLISGGNLTLSQGTVSANGATGGAGGGGYTPGTPGQAVGGVLVSGSSTVLLHNTIVGGNQGSTSADISGRVAGTSSYNLVGKGAGLSGISHGVNHNLVGTAAAPIDPRLGPLADNGGPTRTMALLAGSLAIGAGDPALAGSTDQRGVVRGSMPSIGAFEANPGSPTVVTTLADSGTGSLRVVLAGAPDGATITFDSGLHGTITLTSGELLLQRRVTIQGPGAGQLTVSGNNASRVFEVAAGVTASLSRLTIANGLVSSTSVAQGGGILNAGSLALTDCTVANNRASVSLTGTGTEDPYAHGGGIASTGPVTLVRCTLSGNTVSLTAGNLDFGNANGGGLYANGGAVSLTNSTVSGNSVSGTFTGGGGAGYAYGGGLTEDNGILSLTGSTVSGNQVSAGNGTGFGGGLHAYNSTVTLTACTVANNTAGSGSGDSHGGGVSDIAATFSLTSCTVSGNAANGPGATGGGVYFDGSAGSFRLRNTIVAGNSSASTGSDAGGGFGSQGYNLVGIADGSTGWVGNDRTGTAASPLDPHLGPLADNGGPTRTMVLLAGSPAIGAGDPALAGSSDQRGVVRGNPVSIGSIELNGATATVERSVATSVYGRSVTFTATVTNGSTPVTVGSVTFTEGAATLGTVMVNGSGQAAYSTTLLTVAGSPHTITASYNPGAGYLASSGTASLTITPAPLTVRADNLSRPYGSPNPTLTASYSGFVNGDTAASLTGTLNLSTTATAASPAGTYPITGSGTLASPNYTISYANGTLTVTRAPVTIVAEDKLKVYGSPNPTLTASGLPPDLTTPPVLYTPATTGSHVGIYPIQFLGNGLTHWWRGEGNTADELGSQTGVFHGNVSYTSSGQVGQAFNFGSGSANSVEFGPQPFGTADFSLSLWVQTSVTVDQGLIGDRVTVSHGNFYLLRMGSGQVNVELDQDGSATNYVQFRTTRTINDGAFHQLTLTRSGTSVGLYIDGTLAGSGTSAGVTNLNATQNLKIGGNEWGGGVFSTFQGVLDEVEVYNRALPAAEIQAAFATEGMRHALAASSPNYAISYANGTLTVTPAPLTITADDQTRPYGQPNPTLTVQYAGFVNGDTPAVVSGLTVTTTATTTSPPGTYPITPSGATAADYTITFVNGTLTVTPPAPVVTTLADSGVGSLRTILGGVPAGSTITFDPSVQGTITLTSGELLLQQSVTIQGPGAGVITISGNNASRVFEVAAGVSASLSGLTIANGLVTDSLLAQGGGILNAGSLSLTDCTVANNQASASLTGSGSETAAARGGGIATTGGVTLVRCTLSGNSAVLSAGNLGYGQANGGGVYSSIGAVTLTNSTVSGNSSVGTFTGGDGYVFAYGGGLTEDSGTLSLTGCTVVGNTVTGGNAAGFGGGVHAYNSTVTLTSCTVANNTAGSVSGDGDGGGLSDLGGSFTLTGCTVAGNTAASVAGTGSGGGLYYDGSAGSFQLDSTIVAGNSAGTAGPDASGPFSSQGYNLVGIADGSTGWGGADLTGTAAGPLDPMLGTLGSYGGSTQTIPLLAGSPALNAGDPALLGTADQRGLVRTGGVNIGAFQASAARFMLTAPTMATSGVPFDLGVAVVDAFGQAAVGYTGTIHLTTTDPDPGVVLPADYTFQLSDGGTVTFSAGVTLITSGQQTLTATDPSSGISGSVVVTL